MAELSSFEGISEEQLLAGVEQDFGIGAEQLSEVFKMAIDEMDAGLLF